MQISLLLKKKAAQITREQTREEHTDESRVSTQKTAGGRGKCVPTKVGGRGAPTCHAASNHEVDDVCNCEQQPRWLTTTKEQGNCRAENGRFPYRSQWNKNWTDLRDAAHPSMSRHIGSVRWQSSTNRTESCDCVLTLTVEWGFRERTL